jgi:hypothetical protein
MLKYLSNMFVALQNSAPVGGRFSGDPHSLQNSVSGGGEFGAALQTLLQRAMSTVYST